MNKILRESIRKVMNEDMQGQESNYEKFCNFLANLNTDVYYPDFVNERDFDKNYTVDDLYDSIDNNEGFWTEVIYYTNAMNYLMRRDPSLTTSLSIAQDFGYSLSDLNSEKLATLLSYQDNVDEFYEVKDKIEAFLDELVWDYEDYDEDSM